MTDLTVDTNERLITSNEKNLLKKVSFALPVVYSIVTFICTFVVIGLYSEHISPQFNHTKTLVLLLGRNQNSSLIWNISAVDESQNCSKFNKPEESTFFEEISIGELPALKSGCLCSNSLNQLSSDERCLGTNASGDTCKYFYHANYSTRNATVISGGWKLCAAFHHKYYQLFEDDRCQPNHYQYGIYCVERDKAPIHNLKLNISKESRPDKHTATGFKPYKVFSMNFSYLTKPDPSNASSQIDRSKPAIGVISEIAHPGQRPCLDPYKAPDISAQGVNSYPLFKKEYKGCGEFGEYPEEYAYDTEAKELERKGARYALVNQTLKDYLQNNQAEEYYMSLPFFKEGNYFNKETYVRYYTYSRFDIGDKKTCKELIMNDGEKFNEVPNKIYKFGFFITLLGAIALFFIIVALFLICVYWLLNKREDNNNFYRFARIHKRNIHIAFFSFTIISSFFIFVQGVYFLSVSADMYFFKRLLTADCIVIPAFKAAVASFVDMLYLKFVRVAAVCLFLFVWSTLYIILFAGFGIHARRKNKNIFDINF